MCRIASLVISKYDDSDTPEQGVSAWMQTVGVIKELVAVVQDGWAKSGMSYGTQ